MTQPGSRRKRTFFAPGLLLLLFVVATACASTDPSPSVEPSDDAAQTGTAASAAEQAAPPAPAPLPDAAATSESGPTVVPTGIAPPPEAVARAPEEAGPTGVPSTPRPLPTVFPTPELSPLASSRSAPELRKTGSWINSEPFTLADQREQGKVVLVDFWTYTCINCIRTMPYLKDWYEKYADHGLVILGIHTPEFEFEKVFENVTEAVEGFGLKYPIVQDNDYGTWNAFNNRAWPAKYLIDINNKIRYSHFGEGAYDVTERTIRQLLTEAGYDIEGIPIGTDPGPAISEAALDAAPGMGHTRELYAGYRRNYGALQSRTTPPYIRHIEYYEGPDEDVSYVDPGEHENHFMYLQGLWRNERENLVHVRETQNYEDYIAIKFFSTSVNAVMSPTMGGAYRVRVTFDGRPVSAARAGIDVMYDEEGHSYVEVDEARMYFVIDQATFSGGELKLSSNSPEFSFFAFTFGSYEGGEPGTDGRTTLRDGA